MSDITRSEAIKTLKEHLSHWERLLQEHICEEQEGIDTISALKLAIASLETDEAYQLMYEGGEIFTKDDMVAILTELKTEIDTMSDSVVEGRTVTITSWKGMQKRICNLIQSGIDKLEETKDYPAEN
jgi:hypothetical protein